MRRKRQARWPWEPKMSAHCSFTPTIRCALEAEIVDRAFLFYTLQQPFNSADRRAADVSGMGSHIVTGALN